MTVDEALDYANDGNGLRDIEDTCDALDVLQDEVKGLLARLATVEGEVGKSCRWVQEDDDANTWAADCDGTRLYVFNEGGPTCNHFSHCPYCGLPLVEVPYLAALEDDDDV